MSRHNDPHDTTFWNHRAAEVLNIATDPNVDYKNYHTMAKQTGLAPSTVKYCLEAYPLWQYYYTSQ